MTDLYFYLTSAIGVILFGISKGGFAGPIAILSIPLMSLTMSPQTAAGILLPILLVMDFVAIYIYWNKWDLKNIKINSISAFSEEQYENCTGYANKKISNRWS